MDGHCHIPNCIACSALKALVRDVEDFGEPRRHREALERAREALREARAAGETP